MVEGVEEKNEALWNVASSQSVFIHGLMKKVTHYYLSGNLGKLYWEISALSESISYDLTPEQHSNLDESKKECQKYLNSWNTYLKLKGEGKHNKEMIKLKNVFLDKLIIYQRKLYKILKELGYFPSKKNRAKLSF